MPHGAQAQTCDHRSRGNPRHALPAFSLIDLLVSMAVTSALIAFSLPALSKVTESANRVKCASNMRQLSYAMQIYAQDFGDKAPFTVFAKNDNQAAEPQNTDLLRLDGHPRNGGKKTFDGLGLLFSLEYAAHPDVFYCPSHSGSHGMDSYLDEFLSGDGEIVGNFHYRLLPVKFFSTIPQETALLTDSMRSKLDYSHTVGCNVLRADHSVTWFSDNGVLFRNLSDGSTGPTDPIKDAVQRGWEIIDQSSSSPPAVGPARAAAKKKH